MANIEAPAPLDRVHWNKLSELALFERLVAKARELLYDKHWGNGAVPDATTPETLALDAIEDVILGSAAWNPIEEPDPYYRLSLVISSKVANLVRSYRNRKSVLIASEKDEPGKSSPEVAQFLQRSSEQGLLQQVREAIKGSPELLDYVEAASIYDRRAEIAEVLGIEPSEVTNRQKRVRRVFACLATDFQSADQVASQTR